MRMIAPLLFLCAWALNLWSLLRVRERLEWATKPLLLASLLLWYASAVPERNGIVCAALLLGLAGDVLLMVPTVRDAFRAPSVSRPRIPEAHFFLLGTAAFLLGHVAYALAFLTDDALRVPSRPAFWLALLPYAAAGLVIWRKVRKKATDAKPAVVAYVVMMVGMNMAALATAWSHAGSTAWMPVAGALLFLISDTSLALKRYGIRTQSGVFVMFTYGLAQALLTAWFILQGGGRLF